MRFKLENHPSLDVPLKEEQKADPGDRQRDQDRRGARREKAESQRPAPQKAGRSGTV